MTYSLEPHVCRYCYGRILSRPMENKGLKEYKCAECGHTEISDKEDIMCMCGLRVNGKLLTKCAPNPKKDAVDLAEYVFVERGR